MFWPKRLFVWQALYLAQLRVLKNSGLMQMFFKFISTRYCFCQTIFSFQYKQYSHETAKNTWVRSLGSLLTQLSAL